MSKSNLSDYIKKEGTIQENGMILSDDGELYEPDMIHNNTILLANSSWARMPIEDVKGKRVEFTVYTVKNTAYNFKLIP